MDKNLEGLKRSARSRSVEAMARATAAIRQMQTAEVEINFPQRRRARRRLDRMALSDEAAAGPDHEGANHLAAILSTALPRAHRGNAEASHQVAEGRQ